MKVLMFHSFGNSESGWLQNWLSTSRVHFEYFCRYIADNHIPTLFLDEWYDLQNNPERSKGNEIVMTFDDGYLDNLTVAYPILKKYGLKATIFVNPEFVSLTSGIRIKRDYPDLSAKDKDELGFLNWDEIKFLDSTEYIDIQSHSMTHSFYFCENVVNDIYEGKREQYWMSWIAQPEKKTFWMVEDQRDFVPYGTPMFKEYRALGLRRYFPDPVLNEKVVKLYNKAHLNRDELIQRANELLKKYPGCFESDEEMEERFRYELCESKRILEGKLNKKVDFLCWPGGGYNDVSLRIAEEAGYLASTIASRERHRLLDNTKTYKRIQRFGMGSVAFNYKGTPYISKDKKFLVNSYKYVNGCLTRKIAFYYHRIFSKVYEMFFK